MKSKRSKGHLTRTVFAGFILVIVAMCVVETCFAQEPEGRPKPTQTAPSKPVGDKQAAPDLTPLLDALNSLRDQVQELTAEVRRLRAAHDRDAAQMELLLTQERLARIEDNIASANQRQADLASNEQALHYRQDNVDQEVTLSSAINRDEKKDAILSEISRGFDDVHSRQVANQKVLADLQSEANRLRSHIEELRKRLE